MIPTQEQTQKPKPKTQEQTDGALNSASDPAHGLMWRLQMTFELHSGYCYSFERKLCT